MPYEREYRMPVNVQDVLKKNEVVTGEVFMRKQPNGVSVLVEQPSSSLEPMYLQGVAERTSGESEMDLLFAAVAATVDPEKAHLTMLLRNEEDPNTGNTVISALSPANEVFVSVAHSPAKAALDLATAVALEG